MYKTKHPRRITIKSRLFARFPANKRVFAPRPRHFNLLILVFSLGGVGGENAKWHKSATIILSEHFIKSSIIFIYFCQSTKKINNNVQYVIFVCMPKGTLFHRLSNEHYFINYTKLNSSLVLKRHHRFVTSRLLRLH
jgi:hypothetical protein